MYMTKDSTRSQENDGVIGKSDMALFEDEFFELNMRLQVQFKCIRGSCGATCMNKLKNRRKGEEAIHNIACSLKEYNLGESKENDISIDIRRTFHWIFTTSLLGIFVLSMLCSCYIFLLLMVF